MYRTLNEELKGFRASLKPETRPWGLFVYGSTHLANYEYNLD